MESMDRARRVGALMWISLGLAVQTLWSTLLDGHLSALMWGVTLSIACAAVVAQVATAPRAQWLAGRLAGLIVSAEFLVAVADRFGLLGSPDTAGVSWGSWDEFVTYTDQLWPWTASVVAVAVAATALELALGTVLALGWQWRWSGKAAAGLLSVYGTFMTLTVGAGEVLRYGVPVLIGAALLSSARGAKPQQRDREGAGSIRSAPERSPFDGSST